MTEKLIEYVLYLKGHGCCPMMFILDDNGQLYFAYKLDISQRKEAGGLR